MKKDLWLILLIGILSIEANELPVKEYVLNEGLDLKMVCEAGSIEQLESIKWTKDHGPLMESAIIINDGAKLTSTLKLTNISAEVVGMYNCYSELNNQHIDLISAYVYVDSEADLIVPIRDNEKFIVIVPGTQSLIPCRPTNPEVNITLMNVFSGQPVDLEYNNMKFDPHVGFVITEGTLSHNKKLFKCVAELDGNSSSIGFNLFVSVGMGKLRISYTKTDWHIGEKQAMSCQVTVPNHQVEGSIIRWVIPAFQIALDRKEEYAVEDDRVQVRKYVKGAIRDTRSTLISELIVNPVSFGDQGTYRCEAVSSRGRRKSVLQEITVVEEASKITWNLNTFNPNITVKENTSSVHWILGMQASFVPKVVWINPNGEEIQSKDLGAKYRLSMESQDSANKLIRIRLIIYDIEVRDMGQYRLLVYDLNDLERAQGQQNMMLYVTAPPLVNVSHESFSKMLVPVSQKHRAVCNGTSYPDIENITLRIQKCDSDEGCLDFDSKAEDVVGSELSFRVLKADGISYSIRATDSLNESGLIYCRACNELGCTEDKTPFLLTDLPKALHLETGKNADGDITLSCGGSKWIFSELSWLKADAKNSDFHSLGTIHGEGEILQESEETHLTIWSNLTFNKFSAGQNGMYKCQGLRTKLEADIQNVVSYQLSEKGPSPPYFSKLSFDNGTETRVIRDRNVTLRCRVKGRPQPETTWYKDGHRIPITGNRKYLVLKKASQLTFRVSRKQDEGEYKCVARNEFGIAMAYTNVGIERQVHPLIICIGVLVPLVVSLLSFIYFRRKAKLARNKLRKSEVINLLYGDKNGNNYVEENNDESALLTDEKALGIPYDKRLEFPIEHLDFGSQIGAGAFGKVLKAQARNITVSQKVTTVAVKTLKSPAGMNELKSLMSELKMLMFIGKHPNLVNLLGAYTKRLSYKELYVILEYCEFGNLRDMLIKNRRFFRRSIMSQSKSLGRPLPPQFQPESVQFSDQHALYRNLPSPVEARDLKYSFSTEEENILSMGDLFMWALHIAKGMEYLGSKRVLHGDLACRNILITEEGTAKISDFGLSRNMYYDNTYKKKSDLPLPFKWLAPESIHDQTFSSQSDVWSYGVTLWEMFSLGKTPYPGMEPGPRLLNFLSSGERMRCPDFAPGYIYDIMLKCWENEPDQRLTFTRIVTLLIREIRQSSSLVSSLPSPSPTSGCNLDNLTYFIPDVVPSKTSRESNKQDTAELDEDGYLKCLKSPPPLAKLA